MKQYPPQKDVQRLANYEKYEQLFLGQHQLAFADKLKDYAPQFRHNNSVARYVALNYPRMISTVSADLLFEEKPNLILKYNEDFVNTLFYENSLWVQFYENALSSSYKGDCVMRIRAEDGQIKIDTVKPDVYFPIYDENNVNNAVKQHILAYIVEDNDKQMLLVEEYGEGYIETRLFQYKDNQIGGELDLQAYYPELEPYVETGLGKGFSLIHHIKNWGIAGKFWGISDYQDLEDLFFAINNRLSRNEHILDKHADPILAVPNGFLDQYGRVSKGDMGVVEIPHNPVNGEGSVPQYIVWDSKLESSFAQIDALLEQLWIISQMSPSLFGITKYGVAESGRALKYKLIRTLSLKHRKQMYWDNGIKAIIQSAIEFARVNGLKSDTLTAGQTEVPQILWKDGLIEDQLETIQAEQAKLDYELTTKEDAISNIDGISQSEAMDKLERIQQEMTAKAKANPFNFGNLENDNDDEEDDIED
jgi:hypothetical protein